eukprot:761074-Hanusia_phi.AAC.4
MSVLNTSISRIHLARNFANSRKQTVARSREFQGCSILRMWCFDLQKITSRSWQSMREHFRKELHAEYQDLRNRNLSKVPSSKYVLDVVPMSKSEQQEETIEEQSVSEEEKADESVSAAKHLRQTESVKQVEDIMRETKRSKHAVGNFWNLGCFDESINRSFMQELSSTERWN